MRMRMLLIGFAAVLAAASLAFWWFAIDARAPARADGVITIAAYRSLVAQDAGRGPTSVHVEFVGEDLAPAFAVEAGNFGGQHRSVYTSFQLKAAGGDIIIDGAVDAETAEARARTPASRFDPEAYARMTTAMAKSAMTLLTHEHWDHVIAVARHPQPDVLATRLFLTPPQLEALPRYAPAAGLAPEIARLKTATLAGPTRIAPGVVVAPMPGHSPGTQIIYARASSGREYLFIGDIVWAVSNLDTLKTRPRFLQWLMFDPDEEREKVLRQVRALHDLRRAEPELVIVPSHDKRHLEALISQGALTRQFTD